jgi:hypothetical protein
MSYSGDIVDRERHGQGTYVYPNSFFKYDGLWEHGLQQGRGTLSFGDGGRYVGEFDHGEITVRACGVSFRAGMQLLRGGFIARLESRPVVLECS